MFSIKKCGSKECQTCKPSRLPQLLRPNKESLKKDNYIDVWGTSTTENAGHHLNNQSPKRRQSFQRKIWWNCTWATYLWWVSEASLCLKLSLKKDPGIHIYICGSSTLPQESSFIDVKTDINCDSAICNHYYSSRLKLPPCCYEGGVLTLWVSISANSSQFTLIVMLWTRRSEPGRNFLEEKKCSRRLNKPVITFIFWYYHWFTNYILSRKKKSIFVM